MKMGIISIYAAAHYSHRLWTNRSIQKTTGFIQHSLKTCMNTGSHSILVLFAKSDR